MRRSTGAILRETGPETIITSAWRGLARNTSEPKRARSWRESVVAIISMAQQARPKVAGHKLDLRAQLTSESSRVVMISGSASDRTVSRPIGKTSASGGAHARRLAPRVVRRVDGPRLGLGLYPRALAPLQQPPL